jgi:hypothetical protein
MEKDMGRTGTNTDKGSEKKEQWHRREIDGFVLKDEWIRWFCRSHHRFSAKAKTQRVGMKPLLCNSKTTQLDRMLSVMPQQHNSKNWSTGQINLIAFLVFYQPPFQSNKVTTCQKTTGMAT